RMLHGEPESGWRAVVEHINRIAIEPDDFGETVDRVRDPIEGAAARRHVGLAESRKIRSDDVPAIGQQRNEVTEHVAGAGETMKQQKLGRARRAGLSIEDVKAVDVGGTIRDGGHDVVSTKKFATSSIGKRTPPTIVLKERTSRALVQDLHGP